jgi:hypothetical protein
MKELPAIRWILTVLFALMSIHLSSRFLELDESVQLENIGATTWSLTVATLGLLACIGAGKAIWHWLDSDLLREEVGWMHCLIAGILSWGLGGLMLGALGFFTSTTAIGLMLLMGAGWWIGPRVVLPRLDVFDWGIVVFVLLFGLVDGAAPPVQTDELYYHLAIPGRILETGELPGGLLQPNGSRPLILHLPFASLMALDGDSAPRLLHLLLSICLLIGLRALGRRHLGSIAGTTATLLLIGSGSVVQEFGWASSNLPTALCVLVALDAALDGRPRALALAAGAALSCKYSAGAPIAAIFLIAALPWKTRVMVGLAALALVSPWWLRNLAEGLHPLFPFTGWPDPGSSSDAASMRFFYLEKYGAGRDAQAMMMLPWNAVMTSSFETFRFLGRLSPAFLALFPLAILGVRRPRHRDILIVGSLAFIGWAAGAHWIRHLLPSLPLCALVAGSGMTVALELAKSSRHIVLGGAWLVGLSGLPSNLGPVAAHNIDRIDVATGAETEGDYLRRTVDGYAAIEWANRHLPADARVALLFEWNGFLLQRENEMGSVEDHIPTRHFLLSHGTESLAHLRERGVTHIVARRIHFIRKLYPFLSEDEFRTSFQEPEALLEDLLLMEASLVYESNRTRVYRLDSP